MTSEPISLKKTVILAILTVTVPIILVTTISGAIVTTDINQHETISKLQSQLNAQNVTINALNNFLFNTQLPFDCKLAHVNDTFQHCITVMQGGK